MAGPVFEGHFQQQGPIPPSKMRPRPWHVRLHAPPPDTPAVVPVTAGK